MSNMPTIKHVRAFTLRGGGADYHDQGGGHWIDDHIATPMSKYPEYRQSRQSFGINVLGTLVVEIEASDGTVGFAVTTGGELGAGSSRSTSPALSKAQQVTDIEKMWDQMFNATLYYGRKGIVAEHDLRRRPRVVGPARESAQGAGVRSCSAVRCATNCVSTRPARGPISRRQMGFIGGKMPLHHGPAEGEEGLQQEPRSCSPTCAASAATTSG